MKTNIQERVALLDGYLRGIAEFSGRIREYTAYALLLERVKSEGPDLALGRFYSSQCVLNIESSVLLQDGTGALERGIRPYLMRNQSWSGQAIEAPRLSAMAKYLSFRVMDMIEDVVERMATIQCVFELHGAVDASKSDVVYFCAQLEAAWLVLQFNDHRKFIAARPKSLHDGSLPAQG